MPLVEVCSFKEDAYRRPQRKVKLKQRSGKGQNSVNETRRILAVEVAKSDGRILHAT